MNLDPEDKSGSAKVNRHRLMALFEALPGRFPSAESALGITLLMLMVTIGGYILIHHQFPCQNPPWSSAVSLSEALMFEPEFCQRVLERYIPPADVVEFKQRIKARCDETAQIVIRQRQLLFADVIMFARQAISHKGLPQALRANDGAAPAADLRHLRLEDIKRWLQDSTRQGISPSAKVEVDTLLKSFKAQAARESELRNALMHEIHCLEPVLAFDWLYIERFGWVFELFAWCWVGVLGNTIIKLIDAMRRNNYKAKEFCLLFPKAVLAPVLAMIIAAVWASGVSESKINFANLPYLLVLFFLLGFATENLYVKIVGLADLIVTPTATVAQARLDAAAAANRYKFITRSVAVEDMPAPSTLRELEFKLKAVAGSLVERGVIARLAKEDR